MRESYRFKEAFIIFWTVLTHKYYFFASAKDLKLGVCKRCYISDPAEKSVFFLRTVSKYTRKMAMKKDNDTQNT